MNINSAEIDAQIWARYQPLYENVRDAGVPDPLVDLFLGEIAIARANLAFLALGSDAPAGADILVTQIAIDAGNQLAADVVATLTALGEVSTQLEARTLPRLRQYLERLYALSFGSWGSA